MNKSVEIDPRWFAKLWIQYKGDLFRVYYGCHKNYSLASLIKRYKQIKKHIPNFPTIIVKNEDVEKIPAEHYAKIKGLLGEIPKQQTDFVERFDIHKQVGERFIRPFRGKK